MIKLEQIQGKSQVAKICITESLNSSNYLELINTAKQARENGVQQLVLDISKMKSISSSGFIALYSIALIMQGDPPLDTTNGWEAIRNLRRAHHRGGIHENVRILNPQPDVAVSLEETGMKEFFIIYTDLDQVISAL